MRTLRTIREVRYALHEHRTSGRRIGLVPTMGALHSGHVALLATARAECDVVVSSLFVNPAQFAQGEDFARYPRDEAQDASIASDAGVDLLFAPAEEEMYPTGFATAVDPGPIGTILEGAARPGHFIGVATVVTRLLGVVGPHVAYFGLKDYQQVQVIRRVVADLAVACEIRTVPTVREEDGLARSSRNAYLSADERSRAGAIHRGLAAASALHAEGERDERALVGACRAAVADGGLEIDYVELRDAETLGTFTPTRPAVLLVAAYAGSTRLIDNAVLQPPRAATAHTRRSSP